MDSYIVKDIHTALNMFSDVLHWEGYFLERYTDTQGKVTVGVGYNLDSKGANKIVGSLGINYHDLKANKVRLTHEQVYALYLYSFTKSIEGARSSVSTYDTLLFRVQCIFADMVFNMGLSSFREFKKMIKAAEQLDYAGIAREMKDSKWFKQSHRAEPYCREVLALAGQLSEDHQ